MDLDRITTPSRKTNDYQLHYTLIRSSLLHHATRCQALLGPPPITRQRRCLTTALPHLQLSQWILTILLHALVDPSIAAQTTIHNRPQSCMNEVETMVVGRPEDPHPLIVEPVRHNLLNRHIHKTQVVPPIPQLHNSIRPDQTSYHTPVQVQVTIKAPHLALPRLRIPFNHHTLHRL